MTQVWSQTFSIAIASLGTDVLELEVLRYAEVSKETYVHGKRALRYAKVSKETYVYRTCVHGKGALRSAEVSKETYVCGKRALLTLAYLRYASSSSLLLPYR